MSEELDRADQATRSYVSGLADAVSRLSLDVEDLKLQIVTLRIILSENLNSSGIKDAAFARRIDGEFAGIADGYAKEESAKLRVFLDNILKRPAAAD